MAKNLIPQIAQMLGVEIGEAFQVKGDDETTYIFTDDGLKITYDGGIGIAEISSDAAFVALVKGQDEIVKLPWKPEEGQTVYSFYSVGLDGVLKVVDFVWVNDIITFQALIKAGWVFPTREEAEAALPAVAKEMGVDYEL